MRDNEILASLTYGLPIRALTLLIAGKAWFKIEPAYKAIDLINARRVNGQLRFDETADNAPSSLAKVPTEIWDIVKQFVGLELYSETEARFVETTHGRSCDELFLYRQLTFSLVLSLRRFRGAFKCEALQDLPYGPLPGEAPRRRWASLANSRLPAGEWAVSKLRQASH